VRACACLGGDVGGRGIGGPEEHRSHYARSASSPDAQCKQTGNYVACRVSFDESWANQRDSLLSCGRAYSTGTEYGEATLWYQDGLLVKVIGREKEAGTWSLSRTGDGPTIMFAGHRNWVDRFAVPGDFGSVTEIEHGLDFRIWQPGYGVMVLSSGYFIFTPDGGFTHHGAGDYSVDEDGNLIVPPAADAKMCEALQS
jgi:hypothetical protein